MPTDNALEGFYNTTVKRVYDEMGYRYFFEVSTDEAEFGEVRLSYWEKALDAEGEDYTMKESLRIPLTTMHYMCEIIKKDFPLIAD
jgi:hypothetical protein